MKEHMDKAIIERIKTLKRDYRFEIIKEVVTDKIIYGINMAIDPSGMLYVNARDARTLLVFDAELNEIHSFEQRSRSTGLALTGPHLITTHWQENSITIYDKEGGFIRSVDTAKEIIPNMMPGVTAIESGRVIFSDLRSNSLFLARIQDDASIRIDKKITIREKRFYDPDTNTWPCLRGIARNGDNLYVSGDGMIWLIHDDGALSEHMPVPFTTRSVTSLACHKDNFCILDSGLNFFAAWKNDIKKKQYTLPDSNTRLFRLCATDDHVYLLKNMTNKIAIIKVAI